MKKYTAVAARSYTRNSLIVHIRNRASDLFAENGGSVASDTLNPLYTSGNKKLSLGPSFQFLVIGPLCIVLLLYMLYRDVAKAIESSPPHQKSTVFVLFCIYVKYVANFITIFFRPCIYVCMNVCFVSM